jgi:hypothetical protein
MKTWDLNAGAAKVEEAMKLLQVTSAAIAESWNDETNREFQENYLRPAEGAIRNLLVSLNRLSEVLAAAEHECREN